MAKKRYVNRTKSRPHIFRGKRTQTGIYLALILVFAVITIIRANLPVKIADTGFGDISDAPFSEQTTEISRDSNGSVDLSGIPEYSGAPTYVINNNRPEFTDAEYEKAAEPFIELSRLDALGRCGTNAASLGKDMLDKAGDRRDISDIKPSGWNQASYPDVIDREGGWLYHRSHLIAHMFAGEDPDVDGERNLVTGTEYMNEDGMLPYAERAVQNWLVRNGGRILYRVTPAFKGNELVCRGVHIEAADVESKGTKFHINVYCYNVEPGIRINYLTGASAMEGEQNER